MAWANYQISNLLTTVADQSEVGKELVKIGEKGLALGKLIGGGLLITTGGMFGCMLIGLLGRGNTGATAAATATAAQATATAAQATATAAQATAAAAAETAAAASATANAAAVAFAGDIRRNMHDELRDIINAMQQFTMPQ